MKIRTDFVTNSSSSNFAVEISLKDVDGNRYSVSIDPDDGGGNGNADLTCTAEDIAKADSIDSLIALLKNGMRLIEPDEENIEEYYTEDPESYEGDLKLIKRLRSEMERFGNDIKQGVADIDRISSIHFKRTWSAWGEGSSCFGWNVDIYAPGLSQLAKELYDAEEGEPREAARKALAAYLADFKGKIDSDWGGEFPSGFMNALTFVLGFIYRKPYSLKYNFSLSSPITG